MKTATAKKVRNARREGESIETQMVQLARENTALRKEIGRLEAYRAMAYRDPLTGLWNRRYFEERLKEEISRSQRAGSGRKFSVMVVDVNGFKEINDTRGHQTGDEILRWVGAFLIEHLRTHDVSCRTGGDEFTVLLPDLSAQDCGRMMARLRDQLAAANLGREPAVSLSLGTASWPEQGATSEDLVHQADAEMYVDKRRQKAKKSEAAAADAPRAAGAR